MPELKIFSSAAGFEGVKTNVVINGLTNEKFAKLLPVVNDVVLGIPMPTPIIVGTSPFSTDVEMLRMVITQTYVAHRAGYSTNPNKINMIKFVRSVTNLGLKEAKDFVDACESVSFSYQRVPVPKPGNLFR
jgi:hypothetical protein